VRTECTVPRPSRSNAPFPGDSGDARSGFTANSQIARSCLPSRLARHQVDNEERDYQPPGTQYHRTRRRGRTRDQWSRRHGAPPRWVPGHGRRHRIRCHRHRRRAGAGPGGARSLASRS